MHISIWCRTSRNFTFT